MAASRAERTGDDARKLAGMFAELDRHRRTLGQRASLGTADMRLLWLLGDGEPRTLRQIAERLGLEQSTANRQVNAALAAGLLTRERDSPATPYRFTATPRGTGEFERNLDATLGTYRRTLDALGPDREQFLHLLRRFLDACDDVIDVAP
ncbi:MarR family winged helix-turn-helix transcriptional regulator [Myceligenerans pegani]|uniref:Winged helix-turn-helix transcriptional regulator n=1 Tax=Myceligenerans pegani TaxID=2776917 RepID=A0ABR9MZY3_9MICO|nr:MarR family winged helix-turn-helix transcriptional regulator [Myceligenerans sp. TRM 65318]MBE1876655.1 winged helix-turn-helix transcriptional regulator [Myceligenerans sp. TRM 65318]MBE3018926.1 winged helix-turn-helix transcriptional regulator [Myceligenerans sp. TRM 65318]